MYAKHAKHLGQFNEAVCYGTPNIEYTLILPTRPQVPDVMFEVLKHIPDLM